MDKRKRTEILETPAGAQLDFLVAERMGFAPCTCFGIIQMTQSGRCADCQGTPVAEWSRSPLASAHLREHALAWDHQRKMRFLDFLGLAIAHRMGVGKIEPRLWILHALPEDFARAAVLTMME